MALVYFSHGPSAGSRDTYLSLREVFKRFATYHGELAQFAHGMTRPGAKDTIGYFCHIATGEHVKLGHHFAQVAYDVPESGLKRTFQYTRLETLGVYVKERPPSTDVGTQARFHIDACTAAADCLKQLTASAEPEDVADLLRSYCG